MRPTWINDGEHDREIASFVLQGEDFVREIVSEAETEILPHIKPPKGTGFVPLHSFMRAVEGSTTGKRLAVAAIHEYVRTRFTYAYEPDFDEDKGEQLLRLPNDIQRERRATCIDIVLLALSCFANIGLVPLYVQSRRRGSTDHALAGVRLDVEPDDDSPPPIPAEPTLAEVDHLRDSGQVLLFDASGMLKEYDTSHDGIMSDDGTLPFAAAEAGAWRHLQQLPVGSRIAMRDIWADWRDGVQRFVPFPAVWLVPEQNPYFTGREAELRALRVEYSRNRDATVVPPQALSGLGGIGKTQTAIEYAYRTREHFDTVLWANAASRETLDQSFDEFAGHLGLPEHGQAEKREIVRAVGGWMASHSKWLLVLDNADIPDLTIRYVPTNPRGHVLYCSRAQVLSNLGVVRPIEIKSLPLDESGNFLLRRTCREDTSQAEREVALAIAKQLQCLPLALEQAAAYIVEHDCSFASYLKSFRRRLSHERSALLETIEQSGAREGQYKATVSTTWLMNFEAAHRQSEIATSILNVAAFTAPDRIPLDLLTDGGPELGQQMRRIMQEAVDDPLHMDIHIGPLARLSLISRESALGTFSVHRLVQEVVRDQLAPQDHRQWAFRVTHCVNRVFPDARDWRNWARCGSLLPHAERVAEHGELREFKWGPARDLLDRIGAYLFVRGLYDRAWHYFGRSLDLTQERCGESSREFTHALGNLGVLSGSRGRYVFAVRYLERSRRIREMANLEVDVDFAEHLGHLGDFQQRLNRPQANNNLERSVKLMCDLDGSDSPRLAAAIVRLCRLYVSSGESRKAREGVERSLAILRARQEFGSPAAMDALRILVGSVCGRDERARARQLLWKWSESALELLGPDSVSLALCYDLLGEVSRDLDQMPEALNWYDRAAEILARDADNNHPSAALVLSHLATVKPPDQALALCDEAYRITKKTLGGRHPDLARVARQKADILRALGRRDIARESAQEALDVMTTSLGIDHPEVHEYRTWAEELEEQ